MNECIEEEACWLWPDMYSLLSTLSWSTHAKYDVVMLPCLVNTPLCSALLVCKGSIHLNYKENFSLVCSHVLVLFAQDGRYFFLRFLPTHEHVMNGILQALAALRYNPTATSQKSNVITLENLLYRPNSL